MTPFELLDVLRSNEIHFSMASYRDGSIMFLATIPGERWEIEVFADGSVELEVFRSGGDIYDADQLLTRIKEISVVPND